VNQDTQTQGDDITNQVHVEATSLDL